MLAGIQPPACVECGTPGDFDDQLFESCFLAINDEEAGERAGDLRREEDYE